MGVGHSRVQQACEEFMFSLKSSSAAISADEILSFARSGCAALADHVMSVTDSAKMCVELDSRASLLASLRASSIIEHNPTDLVASCSSCMSRSLNLAWADLMLAMVRLRSTVAVTKREVQSARSSESSRSSRCTPSSSQSASVAVSLSWTNLCSSGRSMAESVVCTAGIGAGSGGPYPISTSSPFHAGPLLVFCDVNHITECVKQIQNNVKD